MIASAAVWAFTDEVQGNLIMAMSPTTSKEL